MRVLQILAAFALLTVAGTAVAYDINTESQSVDVEIEILEGLEEEEFLDEFLGWGNPPGSRWITVRCGGGFRSETCYPPSGYKYRHFNLEIKGNDCRKSRVKTNKDYILAPRKCRVQGRVFLWPAEYCKGNQRFCSRR